MIFIFGIVAAVAAGGCIYLTGKKGEEWAGGIIALPSVCFYGYAAIKLTLFGASNMLVAVVGIMAVLMPTYLYRIFCGTLPTIKAGFLANPSSDNRGQEVDAAAGYGEELLRISRSEDDSFRLFNLMTDKMADRRKKRMDGMKPVGMTDSKKNDSRQKAQEEAQRLIREMKQNREEKELQQREARALGDIRGEGKTAPYRMQQPQRVKQEVKPKTIQAVKPKIIQEPKAVPIQEPKAVPIQEPKAVPIQEPKAVPIQGPKAVPIQEPKAVPIQKIKEVADKEQTENRQECLKQEFSYKEMMQQADRMWDRKMYPLAKSLYEACKKQARSQKEQRLAELKIERCLAEARREEQSGECMEKNNTDEGNQK